MSCPSDCGSSLQSASSRSGSGCGRRASPRPRWPPRTRQPPMWTSPIRGREDRDMPGVKDKLADAGYAAGWSIVCRLPERWMQAAFRYVADIAWRRQGPRIQVLEANLVRVLGPEIDGAALRAASREVMRRYARYWLEIFRLPVMPVQRLIDGMHDDLGSHQIIFDALESGRGVVIGLPHMGNWDQAGAWIINMGAGSFTTVMERLKPESVYERFVTFREGLGMEVLPASGGARPFGIL